MMKRLVIGMSGATGAIYGLRLLEYLKEIDGVETHLIISKWARNNIDYELNVREEEIESLADICYDFNDLSAAPASGSYITEGMIILPCSMKTLSAIANGYTDNLLTRAADVKIKEQGKLVICPRETPLSAIHLENMLKLSRMGVMIAPPMAAFYNKPHSIEDIVDHHVMKILDRFDIHIRNDLRWE